MIRNYVLKITGLLRYADIKQKFEAVERSILSIPDEYR